MSDEEVDELLKGFPVQYVLFFLFLFLFIFLLSLESLNPLFSYHDVVQSAAARVP